MSLSTVQQSAYNDIQARLHEGFFHDVNEADLNAVRSRLSGLNATDTDAVIDAMADHGLLDRLAAESNDGEFAGLGQDGFSVDERQSLFADLAQKLDGDSLATVSNAFAKAETGEDDFRVVTEFADAVATHASSPAKVDYIEALADETGGKGIDSGVLTRTSHKVDSEAGAIATVLGSLRGSYAEQGFGALEPSQLQAVLATGIDQRTTISSLGGATSISTSFDSARFEGVMRAAASMGDADLKAQVFAAGAEPLRTVRDAQTILTPSFGDDEAMQGMASAMGAMLDSDTTGVMRELSVNTATMDGSALATYAQVMIASGQTEKLADHMARLQFGNGLNENAVDRLDIAVPRGAQQARENAGALGYFVGAVYKGAEAHSADVKEQQEIVTNLLGFVADKIPVGGGLSASDLTLGQDLIGAAVEAAIADPGAEPAQRLESAALPQRDGELAVGDGVTSAFTTTVTRVERLAEP
jgi:hypothetical protein